MRANVGLILLFLVSGTTSGFALPLTIFRYADQAQRHCPSDHVVWLDFAKRSYYSKGQRRYGEGSSGSYVCRSEARSGGYRRSLLGVR